ncbi:HAD family phosphatase [Nitrosomonas sp. Nm166]|uniref:HAD family hydrolase n=1 Tax=Nitrosomonas sp. Nm166 TaxID=1881054 RepID=UPI0008DEE93E|nr:HAD family phosphatase [Nitrosomonas sp. Nm166]SFE08603.1 putative hydrolase of the HAD superfamily [Nitrosomonas sp. Nm166]
MMQLSDQIALLSSSPKTFLFDIGRVLLDFDFESSLARLIPHRISNPKERIQQVLAQKDVLETGAIDPENYARWALEIFESNATPEQFYLAWQQIFMVNKPMWRCVRQLASQNHSLMLISNINAIHYPWIFTAYPEFSYFEHKVLSFEVGFLKPEFAIYQYAINTYQLEPASTIYIDDLPQNIASAKELGFQCWQYDLNNHQAFEIWLENALASKLFLNP